MPESRKVGEPEAGGAEGRRPDAGGAESRKAGKPEGRRAGCRWDGGAEAGGRDDLKGGRSEGGWPCFVSLV
jgi:hypothetical protein